VVGHVVKINTAIFSQTRTFLDITIITETLLINNIEDSVSELFIITEVKLIKSFFTPCVKIAMERNG